MTAPSSEANRSRRTSAVRRVHGRFREDGQHNSNVALGQPWSLQEDDSISGLGNNPDAQVAEVTAYLRMNQ